MKSRLSYPQPVNRILTFLERTTEITFNCDFQTNEFAILKSVFRTPGTFSLNKNSDTIATLLDCWQVKITNMLSFVVLASVLIVVLVVLVKRQYSYWQRLNIPFSKPKFPLGSISVPKIDNTIPQQITRLYQRHRNSDCPIIGFHAFLTPIVILADLKLIRSVLIGDFDHFQNRGKYYNERDDPLSENLLNVEHEKWKPLRNRWSPCFTSSKLKFMFPTIAAVGNELVDCLSEMVKTDTEVKICDLLACYFTDMIASCAFGIEANSLKDPTVKFRTMGKKVFETPKFSMFELLLVSEFPGLAKFLRLCEHHKDVTDYYMNVINETMEYRTTHDIRRNDFMDVLIQMRSNSSSGESVNFTMNEIAAQAFLFFTAGFQGPSITLTNSLYELAMDRHKHIQDKARNEIQLVLKRSSGKLTYDALAEMVYCEQIVNGTIP